MHIAIFAAINRPQALEIVQRTISWLTERGDTVSISPELGRATGCLQYRVPEDQVIQGADIAFSIGGDGTMLGAVRAAAAHGVPVLGVNAGMLGFLTELTPEELFDLLPRIVAGDFNLERRMMLHAAITRDGAVLSEHIGLNDVVVRQGVTGRLIHLDVLVAGHQLGHFGADGLIICSPTGSTAYGLSAGGPIVHPSAVVMTLVPICPHSLSFRPMVIPAIDPVEIICEGNIHGDTMMVTVDGQEPISVEPGSRVVVSPAHERAILVKFGLFSFYDRLREKLQWGGGR